MRINKKISIVVSIMVIFIFISCFSVSRTDEGDISSPAIISESENEKQIPPPAEEIPSLEIQVSSPPAEETDETPIQVTGYSKAIEDLDVSIPEEQYISDKEEIMNIIERLDRIMKNKDYQSWISYLSPGSIQYWSNTANLKKASLRLPVKGIELNNLRDYFSFIFLPSRQGREIDQIKYLTPKLVKAVQTINGRDIVFYHFEKIDNKWKIHLDRLG